jgi:hypothetical protein
MLPIMKSCSKLEDDETDDECEDNDEEEPPYPHTDSTDTLLT